MYINFDDLYNSRIVGIILLSLIKHAELQKRANRANQLVLFFLAGANFWEKHANNCAIMSP